MPTTLEADIVKCAFCGANNRVTPEQREKTPVCGRCRHALGTKPGVTVVTDATFAAEVEQSRLPILVDLWAPWCGPCRALAPAIEALASEMAGRFRFAKLNVDENQQTAARFKADSIPLMLVFKDGQVVDRIIGLMPKDAIAQRLARLV